jgi:hypothetical protein
MCLARHSRTNTTLSLPIPATPVGRDPGRRLHWCRFRLDNRHMRRMVPLFLSAFLTISCGRSDETTHHRFAVTREDGIDVAVTTGGPKYTGDLFLYEMVQELRFDEKVEESLLIRPWSFTMDEEGNFYVADAGNHRIAVFSADGTYLRSIGRQGEGPGDLFGPINVEIIGDQVRVPGGTGERTSYFNRNGRFVESLTFPRAGTYLRGMYRVDQHRVVAEVNLQETDSEAMRYGTRMLVLDTDWDTLATVDAGPIVMAEMRNAKNTFYKAATETYEVREMPTQSFLYYSGVAQATYLPARQEILVTDGMEPVLNLYRLDGSLQSRIRVDIPQEKVSQEEKNALIAIFDRSIEEARALEGPQGQVALLRARSAREILIVPDKKAWWAAFTVDDKGYYWLLHPKVRIGQTGNRAKRVRVLSPEGEYLGDTTWPETYTGGNIVRGYFLSVRLDPDTEDWIPTVYRMIPAVDGFDYP